MRPEKRTETHVLRKGANVDGRDERTAATSAYWRRENMKTKKHQRIRPSKLRGRRERCERRRRKKCGISGLRAAAVAAAETLAVRTGNSWPENDNRESGQISPARLKAVGGFGNAERQYHP
jgi:hypothetical protein